MATVRSRWVYASAAWKTVRRLALARAGFRCQIGLPGCLGRANSADHIIELEEGGAPFDLANVQAACVPCNSAKANKRRGGAGPMEVPRSW